MDRPSYPSYSRATRVREVNPKAKLLALLLKRISERSLKENFELMKMRDQDFSRKLRRVEKIHRKNNQLFLAIAWQRMKTNVLSVRSRHRILKGFMALSKRTETSLLRHSFDKLHKNLLSSNLSGYERLLNHRKNIMFQVLRKLLTNQKKIGWGKLRENQQWKRMVKKIMIISFIQKSNRHRSLLEAWNRLLKNKNSHKKNNNGPVEDLHIQLQDLKVQVDNKNASIGRLQEEIADLKQQSSYKAPQSTSFIYYGNNNRSYTAQQKANRNNKFNSSFDKDSNDGSIAKDPSFGSLLGGSFVSYRSRGSGSRGMNDSNASKNPCNCGYKQKYQKYKANNDTLRKQLQIIKTELEFTKDMNEHMQNQIRAHLGDGEKDQKIDKLRQDLKESHRERDALKEKIFKYEKYVNKLKAQFKTKIQQIYRRVKKSN